MQGVKIRLQLVRNTVKTDVKLENITVSAIAFTTIILALKIISMSPYLFRIYRREYWITSGSTSGQIASALSYNNSECIPCYSVK